MSESYYTISELNKFIKDVINSGFPTVIWVCGEIQQYERNKTKKHVFFELVEKDEKSKDILARIGLVIFENRKILIENVLKKSENSFELKDDIEVKFSCKVDFYAPHGALRLVVENIDPVYTLGRLAQEKQKLIVLLREKGVLDRNKQLELPLAPLKIGLITSYGSAAHKDFLSELEKSAFGFKIFLRNALMQGKNSSVDICRALDELNGNPNIDLIVITRGGGSVADLSCFDNKELAEKIAGSKYPVLSGIGHEIDLSIADLAAHTYAKTPTAIAQFLVERIQGFLKVLDDRLDRIIEGAVVKIENERRGLKDIANDFQSVTVRYLKGHNEYMIRITESLKYRISALIKDKAEYLTSTADFLKRAVDVRIVNEKNKILGFKKIVEIVDPKNTVRRGFTITRDKRGSLIRQISDVNPDDEITTELADGVLGSVVK